MFLSLKYNTFLGKFFWTFTVSGGVYFSSLAQDGSKSVLTVLINKTTHSEEIAINIFFKCRIVLKILKIMLLQLLQEWLPLWNGDASVHIPGNVWRRQVLPGISRYRPAQVLHNGFHVLGPVSWHYPDRYSGRRPGWRILLHYSVLRRRNTNGTQWQLDLSSASTWLVIGCF